MSRPLSLLEQWLEGVPNSGRDSKDDLNSNNNTNKTSVKKEKKADPCALPFPPPQTNATFLFPGTIQSTQDIKPVVKPVVKQEHSIDSKSISGGFGWESISGICVPIIFRETERLVAVRIVENKIISLYSNVLPWKVFSCINIRSYFMTESEAKLMNEINALHCDSQFGYEAFSPKDVVVCIRDVYSLKSFLDMSKTIFSRGLTNTNHSLGFVNISGSFVVPFITKNTLDAPGAAAQVSRKFVPQSMVEQTAAMIKVERVAMDEWDVSYLKMLLIYSGMEQISLPQDDVLCNLEDLEWDLNLCPLRVEECTPVSSYVASHKPIISKQSASSNHHHHLSPIDSLADQWMRSSTASSPNTTLRSLHQVSSIDIGGIVLLAINLKAYSNQQAVFVAEVVKHLCPGVSILTVHHILEKILQAKLYDYTRYVFPLLLQEIFLTSCLNRLHEDAFLRANYRPLQGDKLILVDVLKKCLPQLKLVIMAGSVGINNFASHPSVSAPFAHR